MRVAVFSGSFDPLHKGHLAILRSLSSSGAFDCIYLVVSPQSPFKERERNLTARERYLAAVEAAGRYPELNVRVDDIELNLPPPDYTIRTLDALQSRERDNSFTLVIGADNLDSFRRWYAYERILLEYGVVVYPREGYDIDALRDSLLRENPAYRIQVVDAPLVVISSTEIREKLSRGIRVTEELM